VREECGGLPISGGSVIKKSLAAVQRVGRIERSLAKIAKLAKGRVEKTNR
jgi:hypothetical protein